ncbi:hypothetical protein [Chelativorans sp. Marseille-P2723]|uniref:cell division protein FtsL n=1 Tax=Chelativorans sp. Marseille-P2723 TaxID=2709133 RepID=UPI00156D7A3C|nr:hypothetical protein [Chelativorans sp. Marseille-P2723]
MFRTSDIVLIAVMLSAAAFTYKTKHDAQAMMNRVEALATQIQIEKDRIDVLKADWSLLTQPARLQKLAETYEGELGLKPVEPQQITGQAALGGIPMRPPTLESLIVESAKELIVPDPLMTGGVGR